MISITITTKNHRSRFNHIYHGIKRILLFIILFSGSLVIHAQIPLAGHRDFCFPDCSFNKAHPRQIQQGIYPQDSRLNDYDVKFYGIDLEVQPSNTAISGSVRILAEIIKDQTSQFVLELSNELTVSNVKRNNANLFFTHTNQLIVAELATPVEKGTLVEIEVNYSGRPQGQGFFRGIQSSVNSYGDPVLWTLSEPHNARQWFPCKQVLQDKADSAHVFITTPSGFMAASNGLLSRVVELPGERLRYEWKTYYPIAYYLISMAVSNYQEYNFYAPSARGTSDIFVQNFIYNYPGELNNLRASLEKTKDFMQVFTGVWGEYPFANEKYGHAQAPMGGGMEHQTISTMGYFGFDITAHELAHHWFGNQVTCATWSDIWINEGFASYGEYLAREFLLGREDADAWMSSAYDLVKSGPGGSVYVPPMELADVWRIFSGRLSYKKGAAILHQLRFEINDDDLFFHVMEDFQNTFAHDVASGDDFRLTLDLNTGEQWSWFFDQWYYGEGFPVYEIKWKHRNGLLTIQSSQTTTAQFPTFFKGHLEFEVKTADGRSQIIRVFQDEPLQLFETPVEGIIDEFVFDPRNHMLKRFFIRYFNDNDILDQDRPMIVPNPFSDEVSVSFGGIWAGARYSVYDIQGRLLAEGNLEEPDQRLNLQTLSNGLYIVQFVSGNGQKESLKLFRK